MVTLQHAANTKNRILLYLFYNSISQYRTPKTYCSLTFKMAVKYKFNDEYEEVLNKKVSFELRKSKTLTNI